MWEGNEEIEILTKEFNEDWPWVAAANRKTGAMLFPDWSKIDRSFSPEQ